VSGVPGEPASSRWLGLRWLALGFATGAAACAAALLAGDGPRLSSVRAAVLPAPVEHEPQPAAAPVEEELGAAPLASSFASAASPAALGAGAASHAREHADAGPVLVSTARTTFVYEAPSFEARRLGYLRAGQVVSRESEASGFEGCPGGFFEIRPRGYVCAGDWASTDPDHPAARALSARADRAAPLPYRYGLSRFPTPPLYTRVPTYAERAQHEPELHYHVRHQGSSPWRHLVMEPLPGSLAGGGSAPTFDGDTQRGAALVTGRAIPGSGFAFLSLFEVDGYQYGLSTDLAVMPLDRLTPVTPSLFKGFALSEQTTLPVAFVLSRQAALETGDPGGKLFVKRPLEFREAVPLSGNRARVAGVTYHETRWGDWIREHRLLIAPPLSRPPSFALAGRRWLDVSILNQTLIAYEGTRPVFVTLVSTGRDGLSSAGEHATVQGTFVIHTKHTTWNMGRGAGREAYDLREVPYVQYFHDGFALHGTYWHDGFGSPRSHGCVNLSPADARFLFEWTEPAVPERWHGAFGADGTIVFIHP
jgi:hypothetical protein